MTTRAVDTCIELYGAGAHTGSPGEGELSRSELLRPGKMRFSVMRESEPVMDDSRKIHFAILGAVEVETRPFLPLLSSSETFQVRGEMFYLGDHDGCSVLLGTTGIGKVNAAVTTAALLERFSISEVFNIGCAGAYAQGPLRIGDVLVTRQALCGDEGVLVEGGVLPSEALGFPLVVLGQEAFFDAFPLDRSARFSKILQEMPAGFYGPDGRPSSGEQHFQLLYGPSLTVGMVSGDAEVAHRRFSRYEAFAENMEGSAVAQTCFRYGIPVMECRGISNVVGDRDKRNWRLDAAMLHCRAVVQKWLEIR